MRRNDEVEEIIEIGDKIGKGKENKGKKRKEENENENKIK